MAQAEVNKLYKVSNVNSASNEKTSALEINGNVNLTIYGSEKREEEISAVSDMTPISDNITETFYQTLSNTPTYIAFIGTADFISLQGHNLEYEKDIS
jgi:hypothetical protein